MLNCVSAYFLALERRPTLTKCVAWVAGEALIDLLPLGDDKRAVVGGGAANTAKALANLGITTSFIGGISSDEYGELIRKELESLDLSLALNSDLPTALAVVSLGSDGSASYEFRLEGTATFDFRKDWLSKDRPEVLHIGTLATIIEPGASELFEWARALDVPVVFDPNVRPSVLPDREKYRDAIEKWARIASVVKLSDEDLAWLQSQSCDVIVSIAGETVDEYGALARRLRGQRGIKAIEVNISCPNVANRGQVFSCDPVTARAAIEAVRINLGGEFPIIAKLSPDVTDIVAIAKEVVEAGADGLALINTLLGMVINPKTLKPHLAGKTGGLSGPAIRPVAVRAIYQVREKFPSVAIVGMGGVVHGEDALELVAAGANAVSVGTASFGNPMSVIEVRDRLTLLIQGHGFTRFAEAVGIAHER